jgi:signal transduction histidine kinase
VTPTDVLADPVRLRAVDDLGLLGQPCEDRFDRVTRTLARVLDVPVALLTLVTDDVVAVVSAVGPGDLRTTGLRSALCSEVVRRQEPLLVTDAAATTCEAATPLVDGPGHRAYAGVPLRGPDGQVVGTLCGLDVRARTWSPAELAALLDVSRWAEAELARGDADRQRALSELALERMKDELISVVSHELRTPLTSLKGALGLLTAGVVGTLPPSGQELARIALANADRLAHLVDEICDLERLSAGQVSLERRPHAMSDLVRQAAEHVAPQAARPASPCAAPSATSRRGSTDRACDRRWSTCWATPSGRVRRDRWSTCGAPRPRTSCRSRWRTRGAASPPVTSSASSARSRAGAPPTTACTAAPGSGSPSRAASWRRTAGA